MNLPKRRHQEQVRVVENFNLKERLVVGDDLKKLVEAVKKPTFPVNVADMLKEENVAVIAIIEQGWSLNGNYYSTERLAELPRIIESYGPIQFINHITEDNLARGVQELVSYSRYVWYDEKTMKVYAAVYFPKTKIDTSWVYEIVEKDPEKIGVSIAAYVQVTEEYEKDGKTGNLIEKWVGWDSADYVLFPSAGGGGIAASEQVVQQAKESVQAKKSEVKITTVQQAIVEGFALIQELVSVKQYVDDRIHRDYFYRVLDALYEVFWDIQWGDEILPDERQQALQTAFDDAMSVLSELDYIKGIKSTEQIINERDNSMKLEEITLEQLQAGNPGLIKIISEAAVSALDKDNLAKAVKDLKEEVGELTESLRKATEDSDGIQKKLDVAQGKLDIFEKAEKIEASETHITAMLKKYSIAEGLISKKFRKDLLEKDEAGVEEAVKDRAELIEDARKPEEEIVEGADKTLITDSTGKEVKKATEEPTYSEAGFVSEIVG